MAIIVGNKPIIVVQGATKDIRRKFSESVTQNIESVSIVCNDLGLNLSLAKTEGGEFTYRLNDNVTGKFPVTNTTYDMVVTYTDGAVGIQTGVPFKVVERQNPIGGEE